MEKAMELLEKHVQWLAIGLGGLFVLLMAYLYLLQSPVTTQVGSEEATPGTVDNLIRTGVAKRLDNEIRAPVNVAEVFGNKVADPQEQWASTFDAKLPATAVSSTLFEGVPGAKVDQTGPVNGGGLQRVAALPTLAPATIDSTKTGHSQVVLAPAVNPAGGMVAPGGQPGMQQQPGRMFQDVQPGNNAGAGNPGGKNMGGVGADGLPVAQMGDRQWVLLSYTLPMRNLPKQWNDLRLGDRETSLLGIELYRQEIGREGKWGTATLVPRLPQNRVMPIPDAADPQTVGYFLQWVATESAMTELLQPAFYQVTQGDDPWVEKVEQPVMELPVPEAVPAPQPTRPTPPTRVPNRPGQTGPRPPSGGGRGAGGGGGAGGSSQRPSGGGGGGARGGGGGARGGRSPALVMPSGDEIGLSGSSSAAASSDASEQASPAVVAPELLGPLAQLGAPGGSSRRPLPPGVNPQRPLPPEFGQNQQQPLPPPPMNDPNRVPGVAPALTTPPASFLPREVPQLAVGGWAFDDTAVEGHTYRYQVRWAIKNPVFQTQNVTDNPELEKQLAIWSTLEADNWSQPLTISGLSDFYIVKNWGTRPPSDGVQFDVYKWQNGKWQKKMFKVQPGEAIGMNDGTVDYSTGYTLVDVRYDRITDRPVAVLMGPGGNLISRNYDEDRGNTRQTELNRIVTLAEPADGEVAGGP